MLMRIIATVIMIIAFSGCMQSGLYEKVTFMPRQQWDYAFQPEFNFEIKDTTSSYRLYFLLRHDDAYAFNNLWVKVDSRLPGDSILQSERFEFRLAADQRWLGSGMDDIYDHRILLYRDPVRFRKPGIYTVRFRQDMRTDPLEHILNAGLRMEKIN